ncbi:MAG: reverse gyrase [Candidatus Methanomethylicaceae archaeon]
MRVIYHGLCLNCRGAISDERLLKFGICENCLERVDDLRSWKHVLKTLERRGNLRFADDIFNFYKAFGDLSKFFRKAVGHRMWSLQEVWAKRVLLKRSFSIVAPTGVGKTVFGIVLALHFATNGRRSYIVVPTTLLVQQISEKIDAYSERLGIRPRKICYHSGLIEKEKKELLERVANGDFDVLVTTERFLKNHFELLRGKHFDFMFVDDVDSFLRSPRNIDRILEILGFDNATIASAIQLMVFRREAARLKRMGERPSEVLARIESIKSQIENYKAKNNIGLLVVSGATMKAKRTKRIKLFEELLEFQIGFKPELLRNIKDFYLEAKEDVEDQALSLIKTFGSGCLIFVPSVFGREHALKLGEFLNANGVKANTYAKLNDALLAAFERGEYDALIGVASFRSPLARGVDLPERVRYVIFTGVPRMEIRLSWEEYSPARLLTLLKNIRELLEEDQREKASQIINKLRRISATDRQTLERIKASIESGTQLNGYEDYVKKTILEAKDFLKSVLTPKLVDGILKSKDISLKTKDGNFYLIVSDPVAYIQASGRASRMYAGGITRGASFLLVDDEKAFYSLRRKLEFILGESRWSRFDTKTAEKWLKKVDADRAIIREIREGRVVKKVKDFVKAALLIVESPTKARTISRFFGKPYKRKIGNVTVFEVNTGEFLLNIVASLGHIYELVTNEGFHGVKLQNGDFVPVYDFIKKCKRCGEQFTSLEFCPKCRSHELYSKNNLVSTMREIALEVNTVFIATDPDVEGEKIAYDIYCSLYPLNTKVERLEFHEITRRAFLQAVKNRRSINLRLVEAQLVRRIEDRWMGFELSQKLWSRFNNHTLSAGRVQTPVLGWIIERVSESRRKKKVLSAILSNDLKVSIENPSTQFPPEQIKDRINELRARILDLKTEERSINPPPPYTTDAMLRDASLKLGFSATKTMMVAQDLFETGLCTYHRTDSTTVSTTGINVAKEYIKEKYPSLFFPRRYSMESAHECIRPTKPLDVEQLKNLIYMGVLRTPKKLTGEHFQLYDLIFRRFIASQMREAKILYQRFKVLIDGNQGSVEIPIKVLSEGFNKVMPIKTANPVAEGEYALKSAKVIYVPAARPFTQGEVIALMKEKGIGRPSTYARTIATILERNYAVERWNRLISTILGYKVYKYLSMRFGKYTSEEATRKLELIMGMIEQGQVNYKEALKELYREILEIKNLDSRNLVNCGV